MRIRQPRQNPPALFFNKRPDTDFDYLYPATFLNQLQVLRFWPLLRHLPEQHWSLLLHSAFGAPQEGGAQPPMSND
jgi:hypothetical protein